MDRSNTAENTEENTTLDYAGLLDEFKKWESLATATSLLSRWNKGYLKEAQENHTGDSSGNTLLHYSCYNGWYDLSVKLIEVYGLDPQARNSRGMTALHMACGFNNNLNLVQYLVESCTCDPFQLNSNGRTAIYYAIAVRSHTILQYFMENCGCGSLNTMPAAIDILSVALKYRNYDIIKWLISEQGGCCSSDILKLLYDYDRDVSLLHSIMSHCSNPNVQDENGNTVLHKICLYPSSNGPLELAKFNILVFEHNCNPDIANNKGETPLHIICSSMVKEGYTDAKCQLLFFLAKICPHIKFNSSNISVLSAVCKAVLQGHHDPSILHYLINGRGYDPSNDSDIIIYTLCNMLCNWGQQCSLDLLLQIIKKYKPYIILKNNKNVCVMCCPVKCIECNTRAFSTVCLSQICKICQSPHSFLYCSYHNPIQCSGQISEELRCDCTLFSKLFQMLVEMFKSVVQKHLVDFLFYCYTSITCECGFHEFVFEMLKALPCFVLLKEAKLHIFKTFGPYPATSVTDHTAIVASLCQINEDSSPTSLVDSNIYTLCQQNPLQAARTIICDIEPPYSLNITSLFYDIISHFELDVMSKADEFDNTLLHLACLFYHGDLTLIEYLLSTGKTDPLCVNCYQQTPLGLLALSSIEHSGNQLNINELIAEFGKSKASHPIESYVNIVVLGNPGVGKSTLVKVLNDRHDVYLGRFRSVSGVELCTAGIVPHILNDKDMGKTIVHDLAGQVEYYSSHTAVLENLLQGSAAVFVIVVSLADGEQAMNTLRFWMSIVDNVSHKALRQCRAMVVTSHADLPGKSSLLKTLQNILDKHSSAESAQSSSSHLNYDKIVSLDCRKLGGDDLISFITTLSKLCQTLRDVGIKEMSLYCHMLYDLLTSSVSSNGVFVLRSLINLIEQKEDVYLPTDVTQLFDIIHSLSSTGLIVYLGKITDPDKFWIIVNKSALLRELNGVLFAPEDFKEHVSTLVSDTGIVKVSKLSSLFPKYDIEMLVYFLEYMHLSQEISEHFLSSSNLSPPVASAETTALVPQERYLFIPALIKSTNKPKDELSFQFGWALECSGSDSSFTTRFIHLLLLHVFAKYTENKGSSDPMDKICHIWNNGIYWNDCGGVSTLLEVFNNNRCLVLLMSSYRHSFIKNMIARRNALIEEILLAKGRVSPKTPVNEFVIGNSNGLQYPDVLENYHDQLSLYSIVQVAQCYLDGNELTVDKNNRSHTSICELLNGEENSRALLDSVFAGRNPEDMVKGNLSLSKPISATSSTVVFKQDESPILIHNHSKPQLLSTTSSLVGTQHVSSSDTNITDQQVDPSLSTVNTQPAAQTLSAVSPYIRIIQENTPQILGILSDPKKLSTELWSHDLLSLSMKDAIHTTTEISRYTRASMIMDEMIRFFEQTDDSENFLKFCKVLINHSQPGLDCIASKMLRRFENYCTNQINSEDSNTSLSNRDGNTVNETERNRDGNTMNETERNRDGNTAIEAERHYC